jgi:hypothetical protein
MPNIDRILPCFAKASAVAEAMADKSHGTAAEIAEWQGSIPKTLGRKRHGFFNREDTKNTKVDPRPDFWDLTSGF